MFRILFVWGKLASDVHYGQETAIICGFLNGSFVIIQNSIYWWVLYSLKGVIHSLKYVFYSLKGALIRISQLFTVHSTHLASAKQCPTTTFLNQCRKILKKLPYMCIIFITKCNQMYFQRKSQGSWCTWQHQTGKNPKKGASNINTHY